MAARGRAPTVWLTTRRYDETDRLKVVALDVDASPETTRRYVEGDDL